MGLLTDEQLQNARPTWLSISQNSGKFELDGKEYPAVEGQLLGFDTHDFIFKNNPMPKFDIFLLDDGRIYQIQLGLYTGMTWRLLNMLMTAKLKENDKITIRSGKDADGNFNIAAALNGKFLSWKYKWKEAFGDLKGRDMQEKRDKMIDKWVAYLLENHRYASIAQEEVMLAEDGEASASEIDNVPF